MQQVTLSGHRFTSDSDIYAALDLDGARTLLSFDARAAQARIEQLPWIERASIERVVPDGVDVALPSACPSRVWRTGERSWLIAEVWDVEKLPPTLQSWTQEQLAERVRHTEDMLTKTLAALKKTAEG